MQFWKTSSRKIHLDKTLIMAILNITPDSFSDGGKFFSIESALYQAEKLIKEGADILDIGGESTRPNSLRVAENEEIRRVVPVIEALSKRFDVPMSIDTSKSKVAKNAIEAGAEIINDISGLRFDENIGLIAAQNQTGLILMHLRGEYENMHSQKPVDNIIKEVSEGFKWSLKKADSYNIASDQIVLDVGIGFSKTSEQNLELLARLDEISFLFKNFPMLIGTSRKSFIGKILNQPEPAERLHGSLTSAAIAVFNGAKIVRVHDVKETVEAVKIAEAIKNQRK